MTRSRLVPVLLSAAVLVGAANLGALAATGGPVLLGKSNKASSTTTLKTTGSKPVLSLKGKAGQPPLKVNSATKVGKLNADLLDGLDGAALQSAAYVYELEALGQTQAYVIFEFPGLPPGQYNAQFAVPAGTSGATGFGCFLLAGSFGGADPKLSLGVIGATISGDLWLVSGGGYVDTRARTHRLVCQRTGGTTTSIPPLSAYVATMTFTRLDTAVAKQSTGEGATAPRGLVP